jgi:hypothetical protein
MRSPLLSCLLALSLASCGSSDPKKEGLEAIQAGKWPEAVASLDKAMKDLPADSPDYMEVAMGHCTALAHVDAPKAKAEFETLITSNKAQIADFSTIVSHLLASKQFMPAIDLMDKGLKHFPEDPKMLAIKDKVVEASKQANDPEAQAALKGLGYL